MGKQSKKNGKGKSPNQPQAQNKQGLPRQLAKVTKRDKILLSKYLNLKTRGVEVLGRAQGIAESQLAGTMDMGEYGMGLFATRDIAKNTSFGVYPGVLVRFNSLAAYMKAKREANFYATQIAYDISSSPEAVFFIFTLPEYKEILPFAQCLPQEKSLDNISDAAKVATENLQKTGQIYWSSNGELPVELPVFYTTKKINPGQQLGWNYAEHWNTIPGRPTLFSQSTHKPLSEIKYPYETPGPEIVINKAQLKLYHHNIEIERTITVPYIDIYERDPVTKDGWMPLWVGTHGIAVNQSDILDPSNYKMNDTVMCYYHDVNELFQSKMERSVNYIKVLRQAIDKLGPASSSGDQNAQSDKDKLITTLNKLFDSSYINWLEAAAILFLGNLETPTSNHYGTKEYIADYIAMVKHLLEIDKISMQLTTHACSGETAVTILAKSLDELIPMCLKNKDEVRVLHDANFASHQDDLLKILLKYCSAKHSGSSKYRTRQSNQTPDLNGGGDTLKAQPTGAAALFTPPAPQTQPLADVAADATAANTANMGLSLYACKEIVFSLDPSHKESKEKQTASARTLT